MDELTTKVQHIEVVIDSIAKAVGVELSRNGQRTNAHRAVQVRTGFLEWLKTLAAIGIPCAALGVTGIRAYDNHDARISALERIIAEGSNEARATHDGVLELRVLTKGWDSRLERIEGKLK